MWSRTGEGSGGQQHDPTVTLRAVAEIERLSQSGVEAVDRGQTGLGKPSKAPSSRADAICLRSALSASA